MRITDKALRGAVAVRLVSGSLTKFVEKNGTTTLEIGHGDSFGGGHGTSFGDTKDKTFPRGKMILLMRKVVTVAKQNKLSAIVLEWKDIRALAEKPVTDASLGEIVAIAFGMAHFEFNTYKQTPKEKSIILESVAIVGMSKPAQAGVTRGSVIAQEVNATRKLSNTPGGDMTPKILASAAKVALKGTKVSCKVLGRRDMQRIGMGAVLGMAKGSIEEPQFIVMEYWGLSRAKSRGATKSAPPAGGTIVLCGKGVTFDTGGLNIKTGDHMYEMHMDMSGGSAVIHTMALLSKLKVKANVIGLVPAIENALGHDAVRPGDILKSLSGKTIEVLNTDAEGRVILADAITYAKRYNPSVVIDVATLTGASLIALGTEASAFMTNEPEKIVEIMAAAEESGDYMWPFPAWEEYEPMVKGIFADMANIPASGNSRYGGVIGGGMFLREFAKDLNCLWIHIDMAPRMTANASEFLAKGAAGAPVRFLLSFIERHANGTYR